MKRHNFKELLIWQLGMDIVDDVYLLTRDYPREELFGLSLQTRKSAISCPSNIAEGCGRGTDPQLINFLNIAQGSSFELETQLYIALRQEYADPTFIRKVIEKIGQHQRMIDGFADRFI